MTRYDLLKRLRRLDGILTGGLAPQATPRERNSAGRDLLAVIREDVASEPIEDDAALPRDLRGFTHVVSSS